MPCIESVKTGNMKRMKCNCHKTKPEKSIKLFRSKIVRNGTKKDKTKRTRSSKQN
jgi:hypothetical protein